MYDTTSNVSYGIEYVACGVNDNVSWDKELYVIRQFGDKFTWFE